MALTVPEYIPRSATSGERLFFETLKRHLPDDYIVYYEPEIQGRRPDFVIIGPDLGLVVLEVKDYTKHTLHQINHDEWQLRTTNGELVTVKNPFKQARDNVRLLANQLKKDKNLVMQEGSYQGNLKFAYGFGTVFTRLKQADFVKQGIYQVIAPEFVLCRDEVDPDDEGFSSEILQEKIHGMFTVWSQRRYVLSNEDIQAIRFHLFPEVRISAEYKEPVYYQDQLLLSLHNIKTMDLHQENMARQLGDRHRLIRGVAGSGKTLVLASRAKLLAKENPSWRILVLCYGIPLSRSLKQLIDRKFEEPEDLFDFIQQGETDTINCPVEVYNFHEWLRNCFRMKEEAIPGLIEKIIKKEAIVPKYDAILIDEGQDFEPEWLRLLSMCLNPDTQCLLLVEDRAQTIYKRRISLAQETGLDFRGRSRILTINYRNTAQIVKFAWEFFQNHSQLQNKVQAGYTEGVEIIPPQATKRRGPEPVIIQCQGFSKEMELVLQEIHKLVNEKKLALHEIAILYRVKQTHQTSYIDIITRKLAEKKINFDWLTENPESKRNFVRQDNRVKITTIESAKGLDFRAVFIVNIENMPFPLVEADEREVSLFYIGMTRALDYLYLTYSGQSKFTKFLDEVTLQRQKSLTNLKSEGKRG